MWHLYQLFAAILLLLAAPFLLLFRGRHYLPTLTGRLGGFEGHARRGGLWLHAVSVGEAAIAATLARELPTEIPLLVTTVTPTGQARARESLAGRAQVTYLPFDFGWPVRRFLDRFEPRQGVLIEGDYWPLLLAQLRQREVGVTVVNGRVSDASFRRMRLFRPLVGPLLRPVDRFGVQTEEDRERLVRLGVPPERVTVTGNLKFDAPMPEPRKELEELVRELAGGRPVVVAGSTMSGEEPLVLDAVHSPEGALDVLLVLAPRHPERWTRVEREVRDRDLSLARRFDRGKESRPHVLLLDSLGELASLYRVADVAFIGGTLVPTGGHNPLEPAVFGIPIAAGPSMENFREIAELFDEAEAWRRVSSPEKLGALVAGWIEDPEEARRIGGRGAELVAGNRGALERTLGLLRPALEAFERVGD